MKRFQFLVSFSVLAVLAGCTSDPKVQSDRYVSNGDKYYDRGKYKEASIMYRRALQKNMKNPAAWYKLGLIGLNTGSAGEARADFIRVIDSAEELNRWDAPAADAIQKVADIEYTAIFGFNQSAREAGQKPSTDQFKDLQKDLEAQRDRLQKHYAKTFDAFRVAGLAEHARTVTARSMDERRPFVAKALEQFQKADTLKPYDTSVGFAIVSTLAEIGQVQEAEKYAGEMIARKTADDRVYNALYMYHLRSGRVPEAESIRKKQVENEPKKGSAWVALASHYFLAKRSGDVKATLDHVTSDLKTFPDAYLMTGDFYLSTGDLDSAIGQYQKGVKVDAPNKSRYLKKTAEAYTLLAKYDEAGKLVAELLRDDPNDPESVAMNASLELNHLKPEQADKVINVLQPLIAKTSPAERERATILHFNLGRAYALKGDPQSLDQARLHFQEALRTRGALPYIPALMGLAQIEVERGEFPQAINDATKILAVDPGNTTARLIRTMALMGQGEYDKSQKELEALQKFRPGLKDAQYQLARLSLLQKKYPEAEQRFEAIRQTGDPRGLSGLLECKIRSGKVGDAIQLLQVELGKSPDNPTYRDALAAIQYNAGHYVEAVSEFRQLVEKHSKYDARVRENWYLRMGEALRKTGDLEGAATAFKSAAELAPKHSTPRLELAMVYEAAGKMNESRQMYEEVLKMDPDNPVALNNVAYAKADSGVDLDQALALAQRARSKAPQDSNVLDTLGLVYFKKGLTGDSVRVFTELVGREPDNATYHLHLGMAYLKNGNIGQARHELNAAQRGRPNGREQAQIKELLSKIG